jgi:predicted permease
LAPGFYGADSDELRTLSRGSLDAPEFALGYAHRRARVFWFWWMGIIFAVPGVAQAAALAATGQDPENGLILVAFGLATSGIGWLLAVGPRFTRKPPRPADDVARTEQYIRVVPSSAVTMVVIMLVVVAALSFLTPKGTSPEALPISAVLAVFPLPIAAGMLYSRHLHRNRDRLYTAWLRLR